MKNVILIALLLSGLSLIQSCSKEEGPAGPQGPTGLTGATGVTGQNGVSGAVAFEFTNKVNEAYETITIDPAFAASSAVMVYYKDAAVSGETWYPAPGLGANAAYQIRTYISIGNPTTSFAFAAYDPDGSIFSGSVTFTKIRVVFIPYTLSGKKENVDLSDYKAVAKYYGLPE